MTRRRLLLLVTAVVVLAVVAFGGLFALRRSAQPDGYDEAVRAAFMADCVADGGEPVRVACGCVWDGLVATVPFDRFVEVDEQLAPLVATNPARTPLELPDDIGTLVRSCAERT